MFAFAISWSEKVVLLKITGRVTPNPCQLSDIIDLIDAVVISHNHYDHMDLNTLKQFRDDMTYFVPLGNKDWITSNISSKAIVHEMDWWDEVEVKSGLKVCCLPCQHFSSRGLTDRNKTLWASWGIVKDKFRYYFAGDTGYRTIPRGSDLSQIDKLPFCPVFKQIGEKYGPFNLASIPIGNFKRLNCLGAYSPCSFMSPVHCNPEDAVQVHLDIKSKFSIGMHYLTFILTDEPLLEPIERLKKAMMLKNLQKSNFNTIKIGETVSS